ncbi:MarR family transcriptional regulator [Herbiconiux sp. CPCC 205763]|uniref:MarR family transcriptional regulator n=1 Tax=Herbiconiux aconitum TaxID=2970913 RepID=A0ABT2GXL1_9MICO|nr:MarR family transcriptional regulator [Herbiconiux aconitum]MCS5719689.1 MarR family transcriptional regulator [Herbiconiux aconitum]
MTDAHRLLDLLLMANELLQRDMSRNLGAIGLSPSRMHLLWLVHGRGPLTQQQLAESLRVTPRNVTGLVDALTDGGFVTRQPHPSDRRAILVTLTEYGTSTMERTERDYHQLSAELLGAVAPDDRQALIRGLGATIERLEALVEADESAAAGPVASHEHGGVDGG